MAVVHLVGARVRPGRRRVGDEIIVLVMFDGSELLSNCLALMPLLRESPGPIQSPKHTASSLIHIPLGTYVSKTTWMRPRFRREASRLPPSLGHDNTVGRSHLRIRPWASSPAAPCAATFHVGALPRPPDAPLHSSWVTQDPGSSETKKKGKVGAAPIRRAMALMGAPRVLAVRARPFFVRLDAFLRAMHLPAPHTGFGQQLAPVHLASVHECPIA
ncbi:hypothetical protein B0H14DRAFT_3489608 [Mycena olivaceomarginata]|nr:hypothetical protein B0H14DRAFT_3489608 [Mycena olivaceomarginata]